MIYHRLTGGRVSRATVDGGLEHGWGVVGEDNIVRWFSDADLAEMRGVGEYSGEWGHPSYLRAASDVPASDAFHPAK